MRDRFDPARALRHPLWWGALALLLVNDHVLKGSGLLPGWLTGKLSDCAGLVVAPVLLAALLGARRGRGVLGAHVAVGAWFTLVNLWPSAARATEAVMGLLGLSWKLWCDPTDLVALPALGLSAWLLHRCRARSAEATPPMSTLERGLAMAGAVSCMATSVAYPSNTVTTQGKVLTQGHGTGPVYVIDASTGRRIAAGAFGRVVTVETGGVVYGIEPRGIVGIAIHSEAEVLRFTSDEDPWHPLALTDGGRLFMISRPSGSANERLVAFDLEAKAVSYSVALPSRASHRPLPLRPILAGGLVVVPAGTELVAFDPGTGRRRWKHAAGNALSWPTAEGRSVFAVDEAGTIVALDLQHGNVLWTYDVGSYDGFDDYFGARLGAGDGVVAFLRQGRLMAIEADTRLPRWKGPEVDDVVIGRHVAVARRELDGDDHWVAYRMTDGKQLWKLNADDWPREDPIIDEPNGLVLVRTGANELQAFTADNGRLMWRFLLDEGERAERLVEGAAATERRRF